MVFIGLISTSLQPLSPTSWLPSDGNHIHTTAISLPSEGKTSGSCCPKKKSLVTIILVRSPSNFIFTQFGCLLTAPKRKKVENSKFHFFFIASNFGGTFNQFFFWIFLWNFHRRCLSTLFIPWCKKSKSSIESFSRRKSSMLLLEARFTAFGPFKAWLSSLFVKAWKVETTHQ